MMWRLETSKGDGKGWQPGQVLLLREAQDEDDAPYFIYLGEADGRMRLAKVRFDEDTKTVETQEATIIPAGQRNEFAKVCGMVAVRC